MPYKLSNPDPNKHGLINCLHNCQVTAVPAGGSVVVDDRAIAEKFLGDFAARGVTVEEIKTKQQAAADDKAESAEFDRQAATPTWKDKPKSKSKE